jgi:hypothetical protein
VIAQISKGFKPLKPLNSWKIAIIVRIVGLFCKRQHNFMAKGNDAKCRQDVDIEVLEG